MPEPGYYNLAVMKKTILFLCILLFAAAGCASPAAGPSLSPEETVREGFKNLVGVSSYSFEAALSGVFDAFKGDEVVKISIDGLISGQADSSDPENSKLGMAVSGTGSASGGDAQNLDAELKMDENNLFFKISSFPNLSVEAIPQALIDQFTGKWWNIPLPEAEKSSLLEFSETNQKEVEKLKELLDKYDFFTDLKYEGMELVRGEESYGYSARLNKDDVKSFMIENRELSENPMSGEEVSDLNAILNSTTFTGYVYVGAESLKVNKISGSLYVKDVSEEKVKEGSFDVSFEIWDFGKPVKLDMPSDAELLNPFMLLGGGVPSVPSLELGE